MDKKYAVLFLNSFKMKGVVNHFLCFIMQLLGKSTSWQLIGRWRVGRVLRVSGLLCVCSEGVCVCVVRGWKIAWFVSELE